MFKRSDLLLSSVLVYFIYSQTTNIYSWLIQLKIHIKTFIYKKVIFQYHKKYGVVVFMLNIITAYLGCHK